MDNKIFLKRQDAHDWLVANQDKFNTPFGYELLWEMTHVMFDRFNKVDTTFLSGLFLASGQIAEGLSIAPTYKLDKRARNSIDSFCIRLGQACGEDSKLMSEIRQNNEAWKSWIHALADQSGREPGMLQ